MDLSKDRQQNDDDDDDDDLSIHAHVSAQRA